MLYFPKDNLLNDTDLFAFTMADRLVNMIDKELVLPLKELDQLKSIPAEPVLCISIPISIIRS